MMGLRVGKGLSRGTPCRASSSRLQTPVEDPENRFRRYGKDFGKKGYYFENDNDWLHRAPQVRIRLAGDRAKDQIGELAVLNERLAGQKTWEIRKRVEYLKRKRSAWEGVYNAACKHEIALTLSSLEQAMAEVRPRKLRCNLSEMFVYVCCEKVGAKCFECLCT
jgi:hypothetical protein